LLALRDGKVYLVQSGWKRHVPNPPTFEARGLSWASITPVPDGWLPTGKPLLNVVATGWLVRLPGDQVPVYVMDSGIRRHIISPAVLTECGFGWDAITILSAPTITAFPEGPAVVGPPCPKASFPDGTLVLGSDGKVWVTAAGRRHWIFGPGVFAACGYQWVDMNPVPDSIVNTLAHGADLMVPPCP
jgi:hypothetical protein